MPPPAITTRMSRTPPTLTGPGRARIGVDPRGETENYGGAPIDEASTLPIVVDGAAFRRIGCSVDSVGANTEPVRQAVLLAGPQTVLSLIAAKTDDGSAERSLERAKAIAAERGVRVSTSAVSGDNLPRLVLDASAGADLLVVGGDDDSGRSAVVLGSTASTAVHAAGVPVLVARRPPDDREFPRDILVAIDGSPDSRRGVELAGRIAGAGDSRIALVHVSEGRSAGHPALEEDSLTLSELTGVAPTTVEEFGDPADQIASVARRLRSSLLVVGSRGLGGARRLGSVGERLAHEAPCSVLVSRPS
jgi:nucleotide-binding universal stress UspA family protein